MPKRRPLNDELTEREAAKYLRLSHSHLKHLRQIGEGPIYLDYGWRTKRYLRPDLDEWRRERRRIARMRRQAQHDDLGGARTRRRVVAQHIGDDGNADQNT